MNKTIDKKSEDLLILFTEKEISERIDELAITIENNIPKDEDITIICILKGSFMFTSDFVKRLKHNVKLEFIKISSYGNDFTSSGNITTENFSLPDITGKNVIILEDIIDSGLTAKYSVDLFRSKNPSRLFFVTLLNKKCARKTEIEPDYYGFEIDNKFVVGYGMDYCGYYRNLPYIGYFPNN